MLILDRDNSPIIKPVTNLATDLLGGIEGTCLTEHKTHDLIDKIAHLAVNHRNLLIRYVAGGPKVLTYLPSLETATSCLIEIASKVLSLIDNIGKNCNVPNPGVVTTQRIHIPAERVVLVSIKTIG